MPESELVLTKVWNGEVVRVPGLLDVPQWMKKKWEYRKLLMRSRPVELKWKDLDGNTYIADAPGGRTKVEGGKYSVIISSIVKKRPNGSLENHTLFGNHRPFIGSIYDETGNKIMSIIKGSRDSYTVSFFENNEDKFEKKWQVNSEMNIYSEQILDPNGTYHYTYNMKE
ncbi:MAG: hypothetical protein JXA96_07385 [Sedimentisphaerales bacterium]|nr:hypothetical protein [Sedimentisphaerales bacterium]